MKKNKVIPFPKRKKTIAYGADLTPLEKEKALQFYRIKRNDEEIEKQLKAAGMSWKEGAYFENVFRDDNKSKKFKTVLCVQENRKYVFIRKEGMMLKPELMKEEMEKSKDVKEKKRKTGFFKRRKGK